MSTDKGSTIIMALLQRLRDRRIVLPAPARIERIAVGGRARARRLAADAMIVDIDATKAARIDGLLVNDPALKGTPIAWLRDWAEAPKASNLAAILERLAYVRAFELDPKMTERVSEWRFRQLAREGAAAPVFLLDEYGPRRRRATLVAQLPISVFASHPVTKVPKIVGKHRRTKPPGKRKAAIVAFARS